MIILYDVMTFAVRSMLTVTLKTHSIMYPTYIYEGAPTGGLDSNLAAALLSQNRNGNGFGQDGIWGVIYLAIVASIFGWNGNGGFGFGGGRNGSLPAELAGNAGRELLMQAIQGNREAISGIASSLNCSFQQVESALCNIQSTLGLTGQQIINAVQSGNSGVISQLSTCCCNILQAVERQGAETRLQNCQDVNTLTNTMNANTLSLRDGASANTQAILAKLDAMENQALQDKIAALTTEKATLQAEISQRNQNATILSNVGQQIAPLAAALNALQSDVDGIKCKMPNTVPVQWPNIVGVNLDTYRAAAYGAAAGNFAGYGCGCNNGYWG